MTEEYSAFSDPSLLHTPMLKANSLVQLPLCQQQWEMSQTSHKQWLACTSCLTTHLCSELPGTRPVVLQREHTLLKMVHQQ